MRFVEQALEVHQHTLFKHSKNAFFSRNLGQNMLKNMYCFYEKSCKIAAASGNPPQKTPAGFQWLGTPPQDPRVVTLTYCSIYRSAFSILNLFYYFEK